MTAVQESTGPSLIDAQREAYNAAFHELGLSWHLDAATYAHLPAQGREGLRGYVERHHPHLLRAYDADFLLDAIESTKTRCYSVMMSNRMELQQ